MSLFLRSGRNRMSKLIAKNTLIIAFLNKIVEKNTHHYKDDLKYDIAMIKSIAKNNKHDSLVWLSRESGTLCFVQDNLKNIDSMSFYTFSYYENLKSQHVKSFEIDNIRYNSDGEIIADVYQMNYHKSIAWIRELNKEQR